MASESDPNVAVDEPTEESQSLNLEVAVESPSACQRHLKVSIPRADIDRYFEEAVGNMMGEAQVPGFRAGRAPRKLVQSHYKSELKDKIKGNLLMDSMAQVTEDEELSAISEPDFDFEAIELPDEGPMTFEFDIEVRPDFDMPNWKGLKLERPEKKFGKKDIDAHLVRLLESQAVAKDSDDPADLDDIVVASAKFSLDGKEVASLDETDLRVRNQLSFNDGTLEGFGKLVKGAKAGDKKSGKLKVSAQAADEELQGKEVDVEFTVAGVKRLAPPELTKDIMSRFGFENEGELRDAVEDELKRQLQYHQNRAVRDQITKSLTESADWELPPELLKRQAGRELNRAVMELRSSGFSDEQIRAHVNEIKQNSETTTATALKEHFILERIAEEQELEATDEDYDREIMLIAMQSNESPRAVRARIEKQGMMDGLRNQIVERKAIEQIESEAKFKEVDFKPQQIETTAIDFAIAGSLEEIPDAQHGGDSQELENPHDRD